MQDPDYVLIGPPPPPDIVQQLVAAHNQERTSRKYAPLVLNQQLQAAAQGHADHMARRGEMAHSGIGDGSPWDRITKAGYNYSRAGENVAWNQRSVAQVMAAWMGSLGHRRNILGNFTELGTAVAYGVRGDPYWCTVFGTPARAGAGATGGAQGPIPSQYVPAEGGFLVPAWTDSQPEP